MLSPNFPSNRHFPPLRSFSHHHVPNTNTFRVSRVRVLKTRVASDVRKVRKDRLKSTVSPQSSPPTSPSRFVLIKVGLPDHRIAVIMLFDLFCFFFSRQELVLLDCSSCLMSISLYHVVGDLLAIRSTPMRISSTKIKKGQILRIPRLDHADSVYNLPVITMTVTNGISHWNILTWFANRLNWHVLMFFFLVIS